MHLSYAQHILSIMEQPLDQAERCLQLWLREENKTLPKAEQKRLAALLARYFLYEDDKSDAVMLSFLRHYSGKNDINLDDPGSLRHEMKTILDRGLTEDKKRPYSAILLALCFLFLLYSSLLPVMSKKITDAQASILKQQVDHIAETSSLNLSHAAIWAQVKKELNVRRYEDISYWDYDQAQDVLTALQHPQPRG